MNARGLRRYLDDLLRGRKPKSFDADDFDAEHQIYDDHAVLEYPQSGERIIGRQGIQASRMAQPNKKRFTVRRVLGGGGLWISELVLTYDDEPVYVVASPLAHVAHTTANDPEQRIKQVDHWLAGGDPSIPREYGATWAVGRNLRLIKLPR